MVFWLCKSTSQFPACCVWPECVSGPNRAWNENTKFVMQIIFRGRVESRGRGSLMWGERWLGVFPTGRGVGRMRSGMCGCVSKRTKLKGFLLKNRSETSGFCQRHIRLVSLLHLNQQCTRARRITLDKLFNAGFGSSRICSAGWEEFSDVCTGTSSLNTPGWANTIYRNQFGGLSL